MTNLGIQILTKAKKKQLKTYLKLYHEEKLNTDQVHTLGELRRVVCSHQHNPTIIVIHCWLPFRKHCII